MSKPDLAIKRLLQRRAGDWVAYLIPESRPQQIRPYQTEYTPRLNSRLDSVVEVEEDNNTYFLHIEPMAYRDNALPVRMLRYRSDIWEAAISQKKHLVPIIQAAVFFLPEHDNGLHSLTDHFGNTGIQYSYIVLRAWEMSRQEVRQRRLFGLYPLLPLMQGRAGEKPEQALDECVQAVLEEVDDRSLRADLLVAMYVLAERKYPGDLLRHYIRREMLMESAIFSEIIDEIVQEKLQEKVRESALAALRKGLDPQLVSEITGLPLDKVLELQKQILH